jgi:antirestriction protein
MSNNLQVISNEFISGVEMLREAMTIEYESDEEREKFLNEICISIAGDETNIVKKCTNIKNFLDFCEDKKTRLRDYKKEADAAIKTLDGTQSRLKEYTLLVLKRIANATGKKVIDDGITKITYQAQGSKNPIVIDDEAQIPFEYLYYRVEIPFISKEEADEIQNRFPISKIMHTIDKEKLTEALLRGETIDGVHIGAQSEGIRIKVGSGKEVEL